LMGGYLNLVLPKIAEVQRLAREWLEKHGK
jgi:hypothetical protein